MSLGSLALAGGFFITEPAGKFTETESRRVAASHWDGGWEGRGSFYLMSIEFQFRKMKKFWRWMVVMVVQQCECT